MAGQRTLGTPHQKPATHEEYHGISYENLMILMGSHGILLGYSELIFPHVFWSR